MSADDRYAVAKVAVAVAVLAGIYLWYRSEVTIPRDAERYRECVERRAQSLARVRVDRNAALRAEGTVPTGDPGDYSGINGMNDQHGYYKTLESQCGSNPAGK